MLRRTRSAITDMVNKRKLYPGPARFTFVRARPQIAVRGPSATGESGSPDAHSLALVAVTVIWPIRVTCPWHWTSQRPPWTGAAFQRHGLYARSRIRRRRRDGIRDFYQTGKFARESAAGLIGYREVIDLRRPDEHGFSRATHQSAEKTVAQCTLVSASHPAAVKPQERRNSS